MSGVEWIKITTNMFDDEKIKLIDTMPERDTIHYIWIRLLVQAGRTNAKGYIFLNENVPYTEEMLSSIFNRPLNSVRFALQILSNFGMIKIDQENLIEISNWAKYQNVEGMEKIREQGKLRKQKQRAKEKQLKIDCPDKSTSRDSHVTVTQQNKRENKNKKENENKKEDIERDKENSSLSYKNYSKIAITLEKNGFKLDEELIKKLSNDSESVNLDWIIEAIEKSAERNVRTYKYIKGILDNWQKEGKAKKVNRYTGSGSKPLRFTDYEQREFDSSIEDKLLGWESNDNEE